MNQLKICARDGCFVKFRPHHGTTKYHSAWCAERAHQDQVISRRTAAREAKPDILCSNPECGETFRPRTRGDQKFCTLDCADDYKRNGGYLYLSNYGTTLGEVMKQKTRQRGRCPTCLKPRPLVFDHCHKTRTRRGMMCDNCNKALGLFEDDPETLRRAADYLESNGIWGRELL
jgi:hypothetical protein